MSAVTKNSGNILAAADMGNGTNSLAKRIQNVAVAHDVPAPSNWSGSVGAQAKASHYNELWENAKTVVSQDSHLSGAIDISATFTTASKASKGEKAKATKYNFLAGTVSRSGTTISNGVVTYMESICHHYSSNYTSNNSGYYSSNNSGNYSPYHSSGYYSTNNSGHHSPYYSTNNSGHHSPYYSTNNSGHHNPYYSTNNSGNYKPYHSSGYYSTNNSGNYRPYYSSNNSGDYISNVSGYYCSTNC